MYYYNQVLKTIPGQTFPFQLLETKYCALLWLLYDTKRKKLFVQRSLNYDDQRAEMYSSAYRM
jgi:hypothetical protein